MYNNKLKTMIKRIFHPIGQGAFYSERHEGFNMVYDCGVLPKTKYSEKLIKQSFNKSEEIDILFISHFDSDHVNHIETLKKHCSKIKCVILPLLDYQEKKLLTSIYQSIDKKIVSLISNPHDFFKEDTKIIYVKSTERQELYDDTIYELDLLEDNQEIESFVNITKGDDWYFIPYNYQYTQRHQELIDLLQKESINVDKLKSDSSYAIQNSKALKLIYDKLGGTINQNSMFLYSGPLILNNHQESIRYYKNFPLHYHFLRYFEDKVGCIYAGDGDLNIVNLMTVYKKQWDLVGTIQIPHHGDIKSYKSSTFSSGRICCTISVGQQNIYAHPSTTVIADLIGHDNFVFCVTENIKDLYFEIIK